MSQDSIPVIDLGPFLTGDAAARREVARQFGAAFETFGFASIVNHGVDAALVERMYREAERFFAQPFADKLVWNPPEQTKGRGYLPLGIESVAATLAGETPPDLCEALVFASLQRERAGQGLPNIWPTEPPMLGETVNAWFDAMYLLCRRLMQLSALALELPDAYFDVSHREPSLTLRFVNYPDQPEAPREGQLRYGAHHDYGGLTILRPDQAPGGLQVCGLDGQWRDVNAPADAFVINVGDLMARWTNDRWRSTLHRVINPPRTLTGSTRRLSLVAFTGPAAGTEVACLPSCCSAEHPPRYAPVEAGAYIRAKLDQSMQISTPAADLPAVHGLDRSTQPC
ncbi:isopenicillin N synthase family dioxygenase [Stutzerimonas nitrititolerans]|uniref:isopenicillin N synthase family dioxygenase n=3 Tax=Stutzerimonas nitrititolerans TaxID=2482751 RepID=UPI0015E28CDA|nr:isopenicillin N synthase family oxygenase [Stutzerimonas nitrititolerans]MBA1234953.1 isopenicillin N synthase family oxygenase [Stutzerimonas stutzeri]